MMTLAQIKQNQHHQTNLLQRIVDKTKRSKTVIFKFLHNQITQAISKFTGGLKILLKRSERLIIRTQIKE